MKRFFISSVLIATLTIASVFIPDLNSNIAANGAVASAAVVNPIKSATPTLKATGRTATTATLKAANVTKANGYNLYRAASVKGAYTYIGKTTSGSYVDKGLASAKSYYYKAKAYKTVRGVKCYSKTSAATAVKSLGSNPTPTAPATPTPTPTPTPTVPVTPTPTPTPTKGGSSGDTNTYDSSFASQVLKIVNEERAKAGVSALTISQQLVAPANKRAKEITQSFSHTRPDGTAWSTVLSEYNISVTAAGENIAYGYNTPEKVMDAWMNSPGHRANILNASFHHIGIGVYEVNGTVYCSQLFSN